MKVALIAAVARNGVIGHGNDLLWKLPEDMAFFKRTTMGNPVIMGRKTWDSIPARFRPLTGRTNIVVTRQPDWHADGALVAHGFEQALEMALESVAANPHGLRAFVIGGAELYALALPHADELVLTEIERSYEGDARFPAWPPNHFVETARVRQHAVEPNDFDFAFVDYRRTHAAR
ncbi:MAG: dihydrofolate reductase [Burkholderiaceae bacterium]